MKFDIIIPMGCYCASAQALKSVKKRSRSLPFDWVGPLSFDQAVRFLETGFEGFFEKEDLVICTDILGGSVNNGFGKI